ncbi:hypothetical protein AAY473_040811 [Plecturocebus cupreus]
MRTYAHMPQIWSPWSTFQASRHFLERRWGSGCGSCSHVGEADGTSFSPHLLRTLHCVVCRLIWECNWPLIVKGMNLFDQNGVWMWN